MLSRLVSQHLSTKSFRPTARFVVARRHLSSSKDEKSLATKSDDHDQKDPIKEEEFVIDPFTRKQLVAEQPLKSLNVAQRIDKVEKKGSLSVDIFLGRYDAEYLTYPEPLYDRSEAKRIKEQMAMVSQLYPQIWDDQRQLERYHFHHLFQLSASEMMTVFEGIGQSLRDAINFAGHESTNPLSHEYRVSKSIISLIIRNCLTYRPIYQSQNEALRSYLPKKDITILSDNHDYFSDSTSPTLPIGFGWSEIPNELGALPPQEWLTLGQGGEDHCHIVGRKQKILAEENTENFLIYYKDKLLSNNYTENPPEDEPNPASDPFVGCCLVHRSELNFGDKYKDFSGFQFYDVDIDAIIPEDRIVFPAKRRDPYPLNIRALGQTATCATQLGMLKDAQRRTYKHLIDNKRGLLNCDIVERIMASVTFKIFAIESMVYYVAGMHDGLVEGFDSHMEATILKVKTNEFALESLRELQHLCGSEMSVLSRLQDQVNILDCFLEGNIHNRMYLATMGVLWFARNNNMHLNEMRLAPWYPGAFLKTMFRQAIERGDFMTIDSDIVGHLHPSLRDGAAYLEYVVKRVRYATETIIQAHGNDTFLAQSSLYKLADLSMDTFVMTATLARASKSYCNGSKNSEGDIRLANYYSWDVARRVRSYIEELNEGNEVLDRHAKIVNELNLKSGGYFAETPLDPNI